jgi:endonuclease/exonuclease/phosphatase family metal-dependent hydrolase
MHRPVLRTLAKSVSLIAVAALAACDNASLPTAPQPSVLAKTAVAVGKHDAITVMTYNIYQGTELEHSVAAKTPAEFVVGAAQDFNMMRQTNFAERARAIANEIAATSPDLVGMQEVALWRTGTYSSENPRAPAETVEQDFLQMLLDALSARGLHYGVVASVNNFDVQGPALFSFGLMNVRLTDRDVIIAHLDGRDHGLALSNRQSSNFATNLVIPTALGPVTVLEGWAAIDVKVRGRTMRFITTHLDAFVPQIRLAQASEILAGPANTTLPVLIAGDMNTTTTTATYAALTGAGFADVWASLERSAPGLTCCQTLPAIDNPTSTLYERIDLMLTRGGLDAKRISRVGADPSTRTPSGLWPSDHAGLVAGFDFARHRESGDDEDSQ